MLGPVRVLEVPDRPLLPGEQVLHLQARGGVAAGVRAEPGGDLKPSVGDSIVPGAQSWPVPEALLPSPLLSQTSTPTVRMAREIQRRGAFRSHRLESRLALPTRLSLPRPGSRVNDTNCVGGGGKWTGREERGLTSSTVTIAMIAIPCSHTICQKSWQVFCKGPCVAM